MEPLQLQPIWLLMFTTTSQYALTPVFSHTAVGNYIKVTCLLPSTTICPQQHLVMSLVPQEAAAPLLVCQLHVQHRWQFWHWRHPFGRLEWHPFQVGRLVCTLAHAITQERDVCSWEQELSFLSGDQLPSCPFPAALQSGAPCAVPQPWVHHGVMSVSVTLHTPCMMQWSAVWLHTSKSECMLVIFQSVAATSQTR